jgi:predicted transcriptional regulator
MSNPKSYVRVRDVMTPHIETIDGLATVADAIQSMKEKRFGALIIDKRDEGDEYGLLTVHDIARKVIEPNLAPKRVNVYEIMNKPVITFHADMNIRYAIRLLERMNQQRALVVAEGEGTAIGIITMLDMVTKYMDYTHSDDENKSEN